MTTSGQGGAPRHLLVLGCGGFIGSHLLDRLLGHGQTRIIGWDLSTERIAAHLDDPRLVLRPANFAAPEERTRLESDVAACDAIVNLAAICNPAQYTAEPLRTIYSNFVEPLPVLELAAAYGRPLVHFSTSEVYGKTLASTRGELGYGDPQHYVFDAERTPMLLGPIRAQRWTYACAKQLYERLIYAYHVERGLPFAIVRPFNFFGPRMDYLPGIEGQGRPRVMACFLAALLKGEPLLVVDGGTARRTITSIHDAIDALLAILARPDRTFGHFYNIGNPDNEVTILELAERMRAVFAEVTGEPAFRHHPIRFVTGEELYGPGYEDSDRRMLDITRESERLGWQPRIGLDSILRETIAHYVDRHRDLVWRQRRVPPRLAEPA
jgi:UDP-apiose/xylose synthase